MGNQVSGERRERATPRLIDAALSEIDCVKNVNLVTKYTRKNFPTVYLFADSEHELYSEECPNTIPSVVLPYLSCSNTYLFREDSCVEKSRDFSPVFVHRKYETYEHSLDDLNNPYFNHNDPNLTLQQVLDSKIQTASSRFSNSILNSARACPENINFSDILHIVRSSEWFDSREEFHDGSKKFMRQLFAVEEEDWNRLIDTIALEYLSPALHNAFQILQRELEEDDKILLLQECITIQIICLKKTTDVIICYHGSFHTQIQCKLLLLLGFDEKVLIGTSYNYHPGRVSCLSARCATVDDANFNTIVKLMNPFVTDAESLKINSLINTELSELMEAYEEGRQDEAHELWREIKTKYSFNAPVRKAINNILNLEDTLY